MPLGQALGQAGIISPIPRRALRSRDHSSLHFDAPAPRASLRDQGGGASDNHNLHRSPTTPRQLTQSPFPEHPASPPTALRVALKG